MDGDARVEITHQIVIVGESRGDFSCDVLISFGEQMNEAIFLLIQKLWFWGHDKVITSMRASINTTTNHTKRLLTCYISNTADDIQIIINDHEVNDGVLDILRNGSLEGACLVTFNNSKAPLPIVKISNGICENNETETGEGTIVMGFLCSNFTDSFNLTCSVGMENVEDELEERVEVKIHCELDVIVWWWWWWWWWWR